MLKNEKLLPKIKLVVSDLDGTFLTDEKTVTNENLLACEALRKNNIAFSFCTGRPVQMFETYAKEARVSVPVIACNGAFVYDLRERKPIFEKRIPRDVFLAIAAFSLKNKMDFLAYTGEKIFYVKWSERISVFLNYQAYAAKKTKDLKPRNDLTMFENLFEIENERVIKILITESHGNDLPVMSEFLKTLSGISFVPSMSNVLDIMAEGVSKGNGVAMLANYLHIPLSHVCVFGDEENDVSMMKRAKFSVAMKNGSAGVKKAARFLSEKTNNESAFADVIAKFGIV